MGIGEIAQDATQYKKPDTDYETATGFFTCPMPAGVCF